MTISEVKNLLSRITYKPGYSFSVEGAGWHVPDLILTMKVLVPDVNQPDRKVEITFSRAIDEYRLSMMDEKAIVEYLIYGTIMQWEKHECDEWFKLDGKCVHNPEGLHS